MIKVRGKGKTVIPEMDAECVGKRIQYHESNIVPRSGVFLSDIAESSNEVFQKPCFFILPVKCPLWKRLCQLLQQFLLLQQFRLLLLQLLPR